MTEGERDLENQLRNHLERTPLSNRLVLEVLNRFVEEYRDKAWDETEDDYPDFDESEGTYVGDRDDD